MEPRRVLIIEDDATIASELCMALSAAGWKVWSVGRGDAALEAVSAQRPELVLLDLGLPDMDGVQLCRRLRDMAPEAVIVVLTARTAEFEVIVALDAGADDYLTKPFRLTELIARLRAHLRRAPLLPGADAVQLGDLRLDVASRRVYVRDVEMVLRPKEFDLLAALSGSAGQVVSRENLMARVWDEHWFGPTKTLDVHVSALRRKLADHGQGWDVITTVRGHGYRLEVGRQRPSPAV